MGGGRGGVAKGRERARLTPSCPPRAKSPRTPAGEAGGPSRPGAVTSPDLSCGEPASLVADAKRGDEDQKDKLTRMEGAAQQPTQWPEGWRPKSGVPALAAPLAPKPSQGTAAVLHLTLRRPRFCEA